MNHRLSVLVPSSRPEGLQRFIQSLKDNSVDFNSIEVVVLVDDENSYVERNENIVTIHHPPSQPLSVNNLMHECYKFARSEWIFFGNDDIDCQTKGWDKLLFDEIKKLHDGIGLFWPDDNMFGDKLSCFPIISKKAIELIQLFPTNYRRYKLDDQIFEAFPVQRRFYLGHIKFGHSNDQGTFGFQLGDGRIYPIDREAADHDNAEWAKTALKRMEGQSRIKKAILEEFNSPVRVLIGVPTAEFARQAAFYDYFNALDKPAGTMLTFCHGQSPAKSRNLIIDQAINADCTHILFIDDDTQFGSDLLMRLLRHDVDIVTGLYLMRNYPHMPIAFDYQDEQGRCRHHILNGQNKGLVEIVAAGLGCCLIKTSVFKNLEKPYIRLGEFEKDQWCDDIGFFTRVRKQGFKLFCDLEARVGHMAVVTIKPEFQNDKWYIGYDTNGTGKVLVQFPEVKFETPKPELVGEK